MGGIGVSTRSPQGEGVASSVQPTTLPGTVVDEIVRQLGIVTGRQELADKQIPLADDVEVTITRQSNNDPQTNSLTVTRLRGGAVYRLTFGNSVLDVAP